MHTQKKLHENITQSKQKWEQNSDFPLESPISSQYFLSLKKTRSMGITWIYKAIFKFYDAWSVVMAQQVTHLLHKHENLSSTSALVHGHVRV